MLKLERLKQLSGEIELLEKAHVRKTLLNNGKSVDESNLNIQITMFRQDNQEEIHKCHQIVLEIENLKDSICFDNEILYSMYNNAFLRINENFESIKNGRINFEFRKINSDLESLYLDLLRISYLSDMQNRNSVIIGSNGSGKSSFASFLKSSSLENISVLSAQKLLLFDNSITGLHRTQNQDIQNEVYNKDFSNIMKTLPVGQNNAYSVSNSIKNIFSKLIAATVNDHCSIKTDGSSQYDSEAHTVFEDFCLIWGELIPEISFTVDTIEKVMVPEKNTERYSINSLSEGEKALIHYILFVLWTPQNSFIIVDEPETFLHPSVYNRLWDILEMKRKDSTFIYISHSVDFIVARNNINSFWIKSFSYPHKWEIEKLEEVEEGNLPIEIITELAGSRKDILFCEGTKSSLDYYIYSKLFGQKMYVYPVEGHRNIINYTKTFNSSPIFRGKAYGIIDNDLKIDETLEKLKKESIYSLIFNEIEMLLMTEEVMEYVLKNIYYDDWDQKVSTYKVKFFEEIKNEKERIVLKKAKQIYDS